jgi:predicted deacylase
MPVVNMPALWTQTIQTCPVDGRNINFSFPGEREGSFSDALAHALLADWARDAELLIDMHGGDLPTQVAHFTMCQRTGDAAFDAETLAFAACYDSDVSVEFDASERDNRGRACNERPFLGGHALMSEAGCNGLIDESSVDFHATGVLRCAARLGMVEGAVPAARGPHRTTNGFSRVPAPCSGSFHSLVDIAQDVRRGDVLGELRDIFGERVATLESPSDGTVLFRISHPMVTAGSLLMGIAWSRVFEVKGAHRVS